MESRNGLQERVEIPLMLRALRLPRGGRVLEVGCGRGVALPVLSERLAPVELVGIDIDPALIRARRTASEPHADSRLMHVADVRDLPFDNDSFDIVIDFGTCYHVGGGARGQLSALSEIARVLKPGGLFVHETRVAQHLAHPVRSFGRRLPWARVASLRAERRAVLWTTRRRLGPAPPRRSTGPIERELLADLRTREIASLIPQPTLEIRYETDPPSRAGVRRGAVVTRDRAGRAERRRSSRHRRARQSNSRRSAAQTGAHHRFTTDVGSWLSLDVSPDGQTIVFDHLGDLYTIPIAGGKATPLTRGMAMDAQPRFSPDGKRIVFVSDRGGAANLWIMSLDKKDTVQLTRESDSCRSTRPSGRPTASTSSASRGNNLMMYHVEGGSGVQIGAPPPNAPAAAAGRGNAVTNPRYIGAAFGKDSALHLGRAAQHQQPVGVQRSISAAATTSGLRSRDGRRSACARRAWARRSARRSRPTASGSSTARARISRPGLRIRDLESGEERWLAYPVQRDDQESRASRDVYPGMSFTPDSKFLIATWSGKIWKVPVTGDRRADADSVQRRRRAAPRTRGEVRVSGQRFGDIHRSSNPQRCSIARREASSPSPRSIVCTSWTSRRAATPMTPRKLVTTAGYQFQPTWSPDGQSIAYTTWTEAEGGHIWKIPAAGGAPAKLTSSRAVFQQPVFSMDGQRIVALRGSAAAFSEETSQGGNDFVWIPASGGAATVIMPSGGLQNAHFVKDKDRIYASGGRGLVSFRWDGTDIREHVRVSAGGAPGGGGGGGGGGASTIFMSPDGDQALALVGIRRLGRDRSARRRRHADRHRRRQPEFPGAKARRDRRAVPALGLDRREGALLDRQRARDLRSRPRAHVRRFRSVRRIAPAGTGARAADTAAAGGRRSRRHGGGGRGANAAAVQAARVPRARHRAARHAAEQRGAARRARRSR